MTRNEPVDPFGVLGVARDAAPNEIRAAWRGLASRYHPDRFASADRAEREQAAVRMALINEAYDRIRSGRVPPAPNTWKSGASASDRGPAPEPVPTRDVRVDRLRSPAPRRRSRARHRALLGAGLVVALLAGAFHWSMSRTYGYDYVYDGQGNTYADVDCGTRYDRGTSTASELRARAAAGGSSDLYHEADVVEEVCGQWTSSLGLLAVPAIALVAAIFWLTVLRRRPSGW